MRQELRWCRNPFGKCNVRNGPCQTDFYTSLAHGAFQCTAFKFPVNSLYEATENDLKGSWMTISENLKTTSLSLISKKAVVRLQR
jgi:hypothetical protein